MSGFKKAERKKAKLRLAIAGPSGSGKTMGALTIAKGLGGRIALMDTERSSASLYATPIRLGNGELWTPPDFDTMDLVPPFAPEKFIEGIREAEAGGYDILIIDSMTHEWNGSGGCLEINEQIAKARFQGNTWSAWNETTPRHRKFVDAILNSPLHVICTLRSKTDTDQVTDDRGKKKVVKLGMKAETRDNTDYEFTTVLELVHDGHYANSGKDRTGLFNGDPKPISEQTGKDLLNWLNSGAELKPEPTQPPAPSAFYVKAKDALDACKSVSDVEEFKKKMAAHLAAKRATQSEHDDLLKQADGCIEAMS